MKKLTTILILMISVFTGVFAESAYERDRAYTESHPEERKSLEEIQLENNKFMLGVEESYLKMLITETWELKDILDAEVTYSFRAVTFKGKKNKVIVNVVLNTVTVNGRDYKFDKDFVICESAKNAHRLNKIINK